jgi:hypothetical protein
MIRFNERHPATQQILRWFDYTHLPEGGPRRVSSFFADFAETITCILPDGPELTTGLRKLLEAKDCMVRAAVEKQHNETSE